MYACLRRLAEAESEGGSGVGGRSVGSERSGPCWVDQKTLSDKSGAAAAAAADAGEPEVDSAAGDRVHRAVAAGASSERVRRLIELCAQGDELRRVMAVNQQGQNNETPLQAAHGQRRGDLVGLLLEHGADASKFSCESEGIDKGDMTALALCCAYGRVDSVRALLVAGKDANERFYYNPRNQFDDYVEFCTTCAHLCVAPPEWLPPSPPPERNATALSPYLACLEALVIEGGANVNARGPDGTTPLHWLTIFSHHLDDHIATLDVLLRLNTDVNAEDFNEQTPIYSAAENGDLAAVRRLLDHDAALGWVNFKSQSPLMKACEYVNRPGQRDVVLELLRHSSPEARRAVDDDDLSAADYVVAAASFANPPLTWKLQVVAELLESGAPLEPENLDRLMQVAAAHDQALVDDLAARRSEGRRWRAHFDVFRLAQDALELQAARAAVDARRARVLELEGQVGMTEDDGEGSEEEDEGESDDGEGSSSSGGDDSESESEEESESESGDDDEGAGGEEGDGGGDGSEGGAGGGAGGEGAVEQ